jgi:hypothetical protein
MADDRSLSDVLWDYTVYAPIGLAISLAEELPKLSEKGRARLAGRVHVARVVGKFTVGEAQRRAGQLFGSASRSPSSEGAAAPGSPAPGSPGPGSPGPGSQAAGADTHHGSEASSPVPPAVAGPTATTNRRRSRPVSGVAGDRPSTASGAAQGSRNGNSGPGTSNAAPAAEAPSVPVVPPASAVSAPPAAASLAIPGYDTLAASQVVQRLSSLRPDELDAIRRYEVASRGRRTILHRIAQLAADR